MPNIDWTKSMQQTFEYYLVDPETWNDLTKLNCVKSSNIDWDSEADTLGSATIDVDEEIGESYIRIYMVVIQNGATYKIPLGTFLVQTPAMTSDGKLKSHSLDAYTPLLELKEKKPDIGYFIAAKENDVAQNIMDITYKLTKENMRAPVLETTNGETLHETFIANTDDTWLAFITDLAANAKYLLSLDEMGRVLFTPKQDIAALQPVTTFDDGNSSILYPDIDMDKDLYGIPNVVEVVYSDGSTYNAATSQAYSVRIVNDDPSSPTSTVNRKREILHREVNPSFVGTPSTEQLEEYAKQLLKELSSVKYTVTYTRGYYPVRVGDCVRLNYSKAGITNVKAKIIRQSINCVPGCPVTETAVFTSTLWR